jgi:hypothetical protein
MMAAGRGARFRAAQHEQADERATKQRHRQEVPQRGGSCAQGNDGETDHRCPRPDPTAQHGSNENNQAEAEIELPAPGLEHAQGEHHGHHRGQRHVGPGPDPPGQALQHVHAARLRPRRTRGVSAESTNPARERSRLPADAAAWPAPARVGCMIQHPPRTG